MWTTSGVVKVDRSQWGIRVACWSAFRNAFCMPKSEIVSLMSRRLRSSIRFCHECSLSDLSVCSWRCFCLSKAHSNRANFAFCEPISVRLSSKFLSKDSAASFSLRRAANSKSAKLSVWHHTEHVGTGDVAMPESTMLGRTGGGHWRRWLRGVTFHRLSINCQKLKKFTRGPNSRLGSEEVGFFVNYGGRT